MKNPPIGIISSLILMALAVTIYAANDKDKVTPPWMEDVKVKGRSTYLVPKGAKRDIIGAQVVVEPPNEYVARRIYEMELYLDKQFASMEETHNKLQKEIDLLKEQVDQIKTGLESDEPAETD